ncbi:MAG: tRNA (adenosine(37)-N6)-threonylcarbamoyltransferase complex dimerization subunit type 1 TsaB [Spirochaetales bacterium]|nr:tRNA (adenosine(37)-N6)-threonylcarbamoyltransferase complex dimerization subunit type 1 TsaB [Spirochaetales bacterium]
MTTLAFDTSTEILGICLEQDDRYYSYTAKAGLKHSENLLKEIDHLYSSSGIDKKFTELIVCAKGPGSFTGLRIGMSIAKGLADGFGCPVISVPTLDILAYGYSYLKGAVMPILDAKSGKVFTAVYAGGKRVSDYLDIKKDELGDIFAKYDAVFLTGSYAPEVMKLYPAEKKLTLDPDWNSCRIESCLVLGKVLFAEGKRDPDNAGPIYIRPSEAELTKSASTQK